MTELSGARPTPVPYAGGQDGPRRILTLQLRRDGGRDRTATVNIDGRDYPTPWGAAAFEIPADRATALSVSRQDQEGRRGGLATTVLQPGADITLEYRGAPYGDGSLGAPGTVRLKGGWMRIPFMIVFLLIVAVFVVVFVTILRSAVQDGLFGF